MRRLVTRIAASVAVALSLASPARAQSAEEFYRGRTVTILVGFTAGGGYDLYARLLGRHIGRHIPGNPTVVVQNMPGAGTMKATQYVYGVAAKDGLTLATVSRGMVTEPLLNAASFDPVKLTWLGTITSETSRLRHMEDFSGEDLGRHVRARVQPRRQRRRRRPDTFALIMRNVFGAKVKLVTGYPGGNDINLAMERQRGRRPLRLVVDEPEEPEELAAADQRAGAVQSGEERRSAGRAGGARSRRGR